VSGDLRVLQVIQQLTYGGAERVVTALSRRLVDEGAHVGIVAAGAPAFDVPGVPLFPLPLIERRLDRVPRAVVAVARAIRRERPSVVHAHNPIVACVTGLATGRSHWKPALMTMHGVPGEEYSTAARVLRLSGVPVVACGPGVEAALHEHGLEVLATVVNGISALPPPADPSELKRSLRIPDALRLVVSVGRLVPQKHHALALRAIASTPDVAYVIVGDGPLRNDLAALAGELSIADRVRFVGARRDAVSIVAAADLFVLSSRWEGLPLVVLEALAAGTPVVATDVRGVRELVTHERTALLAPDNAHALAAALRRLLDDQRLAESLREGGRRLAARYGEAQMTDRYLELYRSLAR
jgi:glycosyltransferase involved in cell wall biosynthesis